MLVKVESVLTKEEVAHCRSVLEGTQWVDGKITAGAQSALAKHNLQVPEDAPQARALGEIVLRALARSQAFNSAAVPFRVFPPLFNRYDVGMKFGAHVDNAIRFIAGPNIRVRTDLSATLFLTEPDDYDGGELVIEDTYGDAEREVRRRRHGALSRHQPAPRGGDHARVALGVVLLDPVDGEGRRRAGRCSTISTSRSSKRAPNSATRTRRCWG